MYANIYIYIYIYRPPQTKISEKVLIPQEEYPDINFVGLIIGPRGNTLKGMERDVCRGDFLITRFFFQYSKF